MASRGGNFRGLPLSQRFRPKEFDQAEICLQISFFLPTLASPPKQQGSWQ